MRIQGNRPPDWEARRKMVYRHDNWTCQACGRQSGPHAGDEGVRLHAHHIVPLSKGGSNRLSNLETLCEPCHQTQHDHDIFTGDWVGDGPRVYTVGSLRATARGIFAALVIALWIVLVARLIALSGGYPRWQWERDCTPGRSDASGKCGNHLKTPPRHECTGNRGRCDNGICLGRLWIEPRIWTHWGNRCGHQSSSEHGQLPVTIYSDRSTCIHTCI